MYIQLEVIVGAAIVLVLLLLLTFLAGRRRPRRQAISLNVEELAREIVNDLGGNLDQLGKQVRGVQDVQVRAERAAKGFVGWTVLLGVIGGAVAGAGIQGSIDRPWAESRLHTTGIALRTPSEPALSVLSTILLAIMAIAFLIWLMHRQVSFAVYGNRSGSRLGRVLTSWISAACFWKPEPSGAAHEPESPSEASQQSGADHPTDTRQSVPRKD